MEKCGFTPSPTKDGIITVLANKREIFPEAIKMESSQDVPFLEHQSTKQN